ncbi:enoyl-CoA hydratase/isomerase family protein [Gaetbulibacter aestuarii]|uniref:Enoyl-CoA hydratase/isomerase family protein n=1 Tax=Gaetbulibacter aestuarii TaxID=1502358 RepID=A0ABW7N037_9FLAO
MDQPYVTLENKNGIGFVEFFHPNKNAMPTSILSDLASTIKKADADETIKVLVLQSGGDRTFCAGASFNELVAIEDSETGERFFSGFANVINTMRRCSKLIIGRVQGKAVGGGVGLAAATDYCLASKYASIKLSELSIGIGPFVIEPAVSRKMGKTIMAQMTLNAEAFYSADFAEKNGLYAEVFETKKELDDAVFTLAENLSKYNPEALSEMKRVIWEGTDNWDSLLSERAKISGRLVLSGFTKNTLKRFKK